jgi:hypothetical protein
MRKMDVNEKGSIHFLSINTCLLMTKAEKINEKIFQ